MLFDELLLRLKFQTVTIGLLNHQLGGLSRTNVLTKDGDEELMHIHNDLTRSRIRHK